MNIVKSHNAEGDISRYRLIEPGAAEGLVKQAEVGGKVMGVSTDLNALSGSRVDVLQLGWGHVELGGPVAAGDHLTTDADGKAVAANSTGQFTIGQTSVAGVAGDIIQLPVIPGVFAA